MFIIFEVSYADIKNYSLEDLYQKALDKKEFRDINSAYVGSSESRLQQAYSYALPSLSASAQYNKSKFESDSGSLTTESDYANMNLNLRQNLFKGGLYSGIQREKTNKNLAYSEVQKRKLDLYQKVANSFYRIQTLENFLEVLKELEKVSDKRVAILKKRVSIGKSKQTDLLTNEIQNQNLKFEIQQTHTELKNERELLATLTELPSSIILSVDEKVAEVKPYEFYLSQIHLNPEIQIQKNKFEISEYEYKISRGQHLPFLYIDLDATYGEFVTGRKGTEYSGQIKFELPLFEGGRVSAEVQEVSWQRLHEKQKLNELQQNQKTELKNEYENLKKWSDLLQLSDQTLKTAERNYKIYNKELELGLVSNLELLNSINTYLQTKKNRDESFYQYKTSQVRILRIIGEKKQ